MQSGLETAGLEGGCNGGCCRAGGQDSSRVRDGSPLANLRMMQVRGRDGPLGHRIRIAEFPPPTQGSKMMLSLLINAEFYV